MFLLVSLAFSSTTADLTAPFVLDNEGKINHWEFGGAALVQDMSVTLVPPIQFKRGSTWTNIQIPTGIWSIKAIFSISQGDGGGIGLWITDKYSVSGELNGGPRVFRGIGCLLTRIEAGETIGLSLVHNKGTKVIEMAKLTNPDRKIAFSEDDHVIVTMKFNDYEKTVSVELENGDHRISIKDKPLTIDITDLYIGITAQNNGFVSRVDLMTVRFDIDGDMAHSHERDVSFTDDVPSGNYQPEMRTRLRNPVFVKTTKVLDRRDENRGKFTSDVIQTNEVLDVVKELTTASNSVASFKELNEFVRGNLMSYTQKWHKRTMRIVEQGQKARNIMGAAWNYTNEMVNSLSTTVKMNSAKTTFKVVDLAELMATEVGKMDEDTQKAVEKHQSPFLMKFLVNAACVELGILILFFIALQRPEFKEKLFAKKRVH